MKIHQIIIFNALLLLSLTLSAKDYKASLFGVKSDGLTLNTGSIQYAIDFISNNGGGTLVFYVGRYLTGSVELKSNVSIRLEEGAVIVASAHVYDYVGLKGTNALITANGQQNIGISGKGVIEGQGTALQASIEKQVLKGYLKEGNNASLSLIYFDGCSDVVIEGINMRDACGDVQSYVGCKNLDIKGVTISSKDVPDSKGIVLSACDGVKLSDIYFETSGTELLMKGASKNFSVTKCINSKGKIITAK